MATISKDAKTSAIACYFTFIGWIIGFFINMEEKHEFANFHLRQSLGLLTLFFAIAALLGMPHPMIADIAFFLSFMVLWGYGVAMAIQNKMTPVPIVGKLFQKVFKFIK